MAWQGVYEAAADHLTGAGTILRTGQAMAAGLVECKLLDTLYGKFLWQARHLPLCCDVLGPSRTAWGSACSKQGLGLLKL